MTKRELPEGDAPWRHGDPTKKIGLNVPLDEPLMLRLDWLVENKAIYSKAAFIREAVEKAAEQEIMRTYRLREAVKRLELEDSRK